MYKVCEGKFQGSKWLQLDSNAEPFSSWTNTQPFGQTDQMIELRSDYLSVRCIWLYLIMSRTSFRVNPRSIVAWMSRNSLLEAGAKSEVLSDGNWTRTQNHLVRERTLNHLAKLTKWLSCVLITYLYGAFGCILSCHVRVSEWIHTL